jgi:hypothetical protein
MRKNRIATFDPFVVQTKYNAIPIRIYNNVQTGPKIQFGGLKDGLMSVEYHELMPVVVNIPATPPTSRQPTIDMTNLR